jgi:hypothetical protein
MLDKYTRRPWLVQDGHFFSKRSFNFEELMKRLKRQWKFQQLSIALECSVPELVSFRSYRILRQCLSIQKELGCDEIMLLPGVEREP